MNTINETNGEQEIRELSYEELQKVVGGLATGLYTYSTAPTKPMGGFAPIRRFRP